MDGLNSRPADPGIGASDGASIGRKHPTLDQRSKDPFASAGVDAEQTGGLGKGQHEAGHFSKFC
jgi:hypothetical protein